MPATITKDVYDNLERAESTLCMLRDSCKAVNIAKDYDGNEFDVSEAWFEGAEFVCSDAIGAVTEALNYFTREQALGIEDAETSEDEPAQVVPASGTRGEEKALDKLRLLQMSFDGLATAWCDKEPLIDKIDAPFIDGVRQTLGEIIDQVGN